MLGLTPLTPAYPYPFPPPPTAKRANTVLLKNKLVELLPQSVGEAYWSLLCSLLTGKITQEEFDIGWRTTLSDAELQAGGQSSGLQPIDVTQVEYLHNALLLSILYNTTKPTLPPASVSHQGWLSKRKRGALLSAEEQGADVLGELSRKRRRIKRLVGGMTKSEKKRLSVLLTAANTAPETSTGKKAGAPTTSSKLGVGSALKTPSTAAFQQELVRCQAAPSCVEALELPDLGTLNDRMSAVAYSSGITKGVDGESAGMAAVALDIYMRDLISALVTSRPQSGSVSGEAAESSGDKASSSQAKGKPRKQPKKKTLTSRHLSTLLSMRPSLIHSPRLASVERFTSHEALRTAPSRGQRIKRLERAQMDKAEARTLTGSVITIKDIDGRPAIKDNDKVKDKESAATASSSTLPASVSASGDKTDAMDLTSTSTDIAAVANKEANLPKLKVEDDATTDGDLLSQLVAVDTSARATSSSTSPAPPVSLEAELFPELPPVSPAAAGAASTTAGSSEKDKDKQKDVASADKGGDGEKDKAQKEKTENKIKAFHELGDVPSSEDEDEVLAVQAAARRGANDATDPQNGKDHAGKSSKDKTGKKKKKKSSASSNSKPEKKETGRLGLWKILTDILEGGGVQVKSH